MVGSVLTPAERAFLASLVERGVRFMLVGMGAALLQGARGATEDLDLWFADLADPRISEAARSAGGFYVSASFGLRPPALGGDTLGDRFDVVTHMHGLGAFDDEWPNGIDAEIDGVPVRILSLRRIVESKRATGRPKDRAQLPALEEALAVEADLATKK
jgi:hypothetical protein